MEGLDAGFRVFAYDPMEKSVHEAAVEENSFPLADSTVYDIVVGAGEDETDDEAKEETTSPDTAGAVPPSPEGEGSEDPAPTPVTVIFNVTPEGAVVTVQPVSVEAPAPEESSNPNESPLPEESSNPDELTLSQRPGPVSPGEEGGFALLPGEYVYTAEAEGYVSVENIPFTVAEEPLTIDVALEKEPEPEPVPFDQLATVNGVVVTVKAEPGVFPADARLVVRRVPTSRAKKAGEAIEEVRDEDLNVADSYTFDVKVIDPATGDELQPAGENTVEISFSLAAVADENLTASIYHITGEGGDLTAEKLESDVDGEAVTATTDGFSYYTVELTYNTLQYVLEGGASVALAEILESVGLTGEVEAVAVSDASLFDAVLKDGAWVVESHRAFSSEEWMKVTINGLTFEIAVTDDQTPITYLDENGDTQTCANYTAVTDQNAWGAAGETTWYAVNADKEINDRVTVTGNVNLILCDGAKLTAKKGITVSEGNSLTVWAQTNGTGVLWAGTTDGDNITCESYCAGIGGGSNGAGGIIKITGGTVKANGDSGGAGIGGCYKGAGGDITITGGEVTANGGEDGAGIGAGAGTTGDKGALWLDLSDAAKGAFLKADSYNCSVTVAKDNDTPVYVTDGKDIYSGVVQNPGALNGRKLRNCSSDLMNQAKEARIGDQEYALLDGAIDDAKASDTFTLLKDINRDTPVTVNKAFTLELNGKTLDDDSDFTGIVVVQSGGNLTVEDSAGGGAITADGFGNSIGIAITNGGVLTFNGGTITSNGDSVQNNGTATIYGGTFSTDPSAYVAAGYKAEKNSDDTWTVKPESCEARLDRNGVTIRYFGALGDAIAAAQAGDTVILLSNVTTSSTITISK